MRTQTIFLCMRTPQVGIPTIRLRTGQFDRYSRARGLTSAHARAKFIGIHHSTVRRIEKDNVVPGERFIAAVLCAFDDLRFEDLFELTLKQPDADAFERRAS